MIYMQPKPTEFEMDEIVFLADAEERYTLSFSLNILRVALDWVDFFDIILNNSGRKNSRFNLQLWSLEIWKVCENGEFIFIIKIPINE